MLAMAIVVATGGPVWMLVVLSIVAACFSTFFYPAIGGYIPNLALDERQLGPANSAWASLDNLGFVVGPVLGGILVASGGVTFAFVINAITFVVIAAVLWRLPPSSNVRPATSSPTDAEAPATTLVAATSDPPAPTRPSVRPLAGIALMRFVDGAIYGGVGVLTVVLAVDVLNAGDAATGYLNAAIGIGGVTGAIVSALLVLRRSLAAPLLAGAVVVAVGSLVLGLAGALLAAMAAIVLISAGHLILDVIDTTLLQRVTTDAVRGRAVGAMVMVETIAEAVGSLLLPVLFTTIGGAGGARRRRPADARGVRARPDPDRRGRQPAGEPVRGCCRGVAQLPLFASASPAGLELALRRLTPQPVQPGDAIVRQGEPADRFYIVASGTFVVRQARSDGEDLVLRRLGPDDVFGELGLLRGAPRSATVSRRPRASCSGSKGLRSSSWWARPPACAAGCSTCTTCWRRGLKPTPPAPVPSAVPCPTGPTARFYLTTSIAYANNKPGLHTLYEVIGADAIARWHRMLGDDTRFLTGTDEHSINIAQSGASTKAGRRASSSTRRSRCSRRPRPPLGIAPDRFIRTTDPDHVRAAQEMVRRAHANGDIYLGTYEGWYCPNEGFRNATDVVETARGTICPNHPDVPLQWLTERNWFFRLSAYQERLERHFADHPEFVQPDYRRNEMLGFIRGGLEDFSISRERTPGDWGIPFPIAENGETAQREDGSWDPEAGKIYVWFDALINYITGAGFPDDPDAVRPLVAGRPAHHRQGHRPLPHDLLAGDAVERRPRGAAPGLGPRLPARRRRRADEQEPRQLPRPGRLRRRVRRGRRPLRRPPRGRRSTATPRCRWDSFVRRYNADLANDFGNLVNRTVSMTNRYLDGERPARGRDEVAGLGAAWARDAGRLRASGSTRCLLHDALAGLWDVRRRGQQARRRRAAVGRWRRPPRPATTTPPARLRDVLGDLVEACRLLGLAAAPFLPATAPRLLAQLGHDYPYAADGNGGPPLLDELAWGAHAADAGRVGTAEPLFPRLDVETAEADPRRPDRRARASAA